jgi:hypothetical protein
VDVNIMILPSCFLPPAIQENRPSLQYSSILTGALSPSVINASQRGIGKYGPGIHAWRGAYGKALALSCCGATMTEIFHRSTT